MDLFLSSLFAFLLLSTFLSLLFLFAKQKPTTLSLPPGKTGWPIIGETLEYISSGQKGTPENFINQRTQKYSSEIFKTSLAGQTMAVFSGASGNKFLFSSENKLVVSWWPPSVQKITMSSGSSSIEKTKKMRGIIPEFLRPDALQKYLPIMDIMVRQHIDSEWSNAPNREVKAFVLSKKLTFNLACRLFMSVDDSDLVARFADQFSVVQSGLLSLPINFPGTPFSRGIKAANLIRNGLSPIIKERRSELCEKKGAVTRDLMTHILVAADEEGMFMTEHEIADTILGVLLASHDTTSTVISFVVYYLADHPHLYEQVLKEQMEIANSKGPEDLLNWEDCQKMKYSRNVINEAMRLKPPAIGGFKQTLCDFTYAGFTIPKGWKIFWSVYSTNKDPKYFPNPEKFDPSRFDGNGPAPFAFVPFGGGPRMCPGSEFARLEILVFLHWLVRKFRWEKLIPNEKIVYEPTPIPVNGLPIRLFPHEN